MDETDLKRKGSHELPKPNLTKFIIWAGIIGVVLWVVVPVVIFQIYGPVATAAEVGDTFGSVNALFTCLAFALLIWTALMQKEELELQRQELKLTRDEVRKSADAQEKLVGLTQATLRLQQTIRKNDIRPDLMLIEYLPNINNTDAKTSDQFRYRVKFRIEVKKAPFMFNGFSIGKMQARAVAEIPESGIRQLFLPGEQLFFEFLYNDPSEILEKHFKLFFSDNDEQNFYMVRIHVGLAGAIIGQMHEVD